MKPLHIAFVWHMHQPYYKDDLTSTYLLPWVRLRSAKDYYKMPALLDGYPKIRATFNLVPSLLAQIEDYGKEESVDLFLNLSKRAAGELSEVEEQVDGFFLAVVLNLSEQRRHEVEGRTDLGISVQQRRHLVVVLGRSQPNPRQKVGAREVVLVIRLMHVPDEGDLKRLGHAVTSMIAASAFGLSASWRALTAVVPLPASLPRSPRAGSAGRSPSPTRSRAP